MRSRSLNPVHAARKAYAFVRSWWRRRFAPDVTDLIRRHLGSGDVFSVQIGSNDGSSGDPIQMLVHENARWRGLFVEPVPYLFDRLRANYARRPGLIFENVAINDGSTQTFFWIDPKAREDHPEFPDWIEQLGSFNESHVHTVPEIAEDLLPYRRSTQVKGCTFQDVLDRCGVTRFDLLHIDTEGYDWEVLRQVDFSRYRPRVVLYEHKCLSEGDKNRAEQHMVAFYSLQDLGGDMFCLRKIGQA
jgi:FkbM family methyltransferase